MRPRLVSHSLALAAVTLLVVSSASSVAPASNTQLAAASQLPSEPTTPAWLEPAQLPLDLEATPQTATADLTTTTASTAAPPPSPATPTQGGDQGASAAVLNPRANLPQWVRTIQPTTLWSSADASASPVGSLAAGSGYLKPLGQVVGSRLQVYFPGDGPALPAAQAWVDAVSVEPSGLPPWLATSADQAPPPADLPAPPQRISDQPPPSVTAEHTAIVDEASGQMLYGDEPFSQVPQASTTKIATTIVALERAPDLSQRINVTVSASAMAARDGSSTMGLEPGEVVSLATLLHGMMLPSGNDAAEQVALALAGSRERYVGWMNQEAAALGLKNTHFVNPSGMDARGHYSSAYDMAMLGRYAMRNDRFRALAAATRYVGDDYVLKNINRLLGTYPGADGVKVGFTDNAQKTIVASVTRDGHRVYIGLMHSEDLVSDCTALFDWVWNTFSW